jgi:hypothetical protein
MTATKAAWAQMAGVGSPTWTNTTVTLAGKTVATSTLNGTAVRLCYLRLADGGAAIAGNPHYLEHLYDGSTGSLTSVDSANTYTKAELTAVLTAAIGLYGATTVRHHNHLTPFGDASIDHQDHIASGLFAVDAVAACTTPPRHIAYLGYGTNRSELHDNISSADQTLKRAAFTAYNAVDTVSGWDNAWIPRQYQAVGAESLSAAATTRRIFTTTNDSALGANTDATATVVAMPFEVSGSVDRLLTAVTMMIPTGTNSTVTSQQVTAHIWTQYGTASPYPDAYLGGSAGVTLSIGSRTTLTLASPVRLTPGLRYWVSMYFPVGYYPRTTNMFASSGASSSDGVVVTYAGGTVSNNQYSQGAYAPLFGTGAAPPQANYGTPWYGLDVVVADIATSAGASLAATASPISAGVVGRVTGAALAATVAIIAAGVVGLSTGASLPASAAITAVGTVAATGVSSGATSASTGSVTAAGIVGTSTGATLAGTATTATAGTIGLTTGSALAGTATVTSAGIVGRSTGSTYAGTVTISVSGVVGLSIGSTLPVTATTTAAGVVGVNTGASLPTTATVASTGVTGTATGASVPITATVVAAGSVSGAAGSSDASIPSTATTTAAGVVGASTGSTLASTATITAAGVTGRNTGTSIPATVTLAAAGTVTSGVNSSATMATTAAVTSSGIVGTTTGASLPATATTTAVGTVDRSTGAGLTSTATITAAGSVTTGISSGATIGATATIAAFGAVNYVVDADHARTVPARVSARTVPTRDSARTVPTRPYVRSVT